MRLLEARPNISQRELAHELGVSLGRVNYCLKALVDKGWVKMKNFSRSDRKLRYAYVLTPRGISAKTRLAGKFLQQKLMEYELLQREIELLQSEVES